MRYHTIIRALQASSGLLLWLVFPLLAAPGRAQAVEAGPTRRTALESPAPAAKVIPPLVFLEPLPTDPVAWINGKAISAAKLLRVTLKNNLSTVVQTLARNKELAIELALRKIVVTPEEVEDELKGLLHKIAPGKSETDIKTVGANSLKQLRRQAWASRGWKKIYWEQFKVPKDQRHKELNPIVLGIVQRQVQPNYQIKLIGQAQGPKTKGALAEITHLPSHTTVVVGANECLDFLMGLVKQGSLLRAVDSMIDGILVNQALKQSGKSVTPEEIAAYSAAEDAKYAGTIIPRSYVLRAKGMTTSQDNERWRRMTAWRRITRNDRHPSWKTLKAYLEKYKPFFMNEYKKVSHILVRTTDSVTGIPYAPERQKRLEAKARLLYQKASEGSDFGKLARDFSDDITTAKGDGRLAAKVMQRGGGLDPNFQKAAWTLKNIGDISQPVKSSFGWHIIKLDDYKRPARSQPDFSKGTHLEWLQDTYEGDQMEAWLKTLRQQAQIKKAPAAVVFGLKQKSYWSGQELKAR